MLPNSGIPPPPPPLRTKVVDGAQVIEQRKLLNQRAGFNFEELLTSSVKVTGENPPAPSKSFSQFGLCDQVLTNIKNCGYRQPTPIQEHVIAIIAGKRDLMACGQTGSGKTAAYLIPIINGLCEEGAIKTGGRGLPVQPQALILSPVRELAVQIATESQMYITSTGLASVVVYGGTDMSNELRILRAGCNVIVATPGRLMQLLREGTVELDCVKYFVIDEADKMLADGFIQEVHDIITQLPSRGKLITAMFSATFPNGIQKLANRYLQSYLFVVVGTIGGASYDVRQQFEVVEATDKYHTLRKIIWGASEKDKILVFCETRVETQDLANKLINEDFPVMYLHGERYQVERERVLREFARGEKKILIATAVAGRGLDIPQITIVVNYDLPSSIDEYVQQIGRTGRVGNKGRALSFFEINRDAHLASGLISALNNTYQPVPSFLQKVADEEKERYDIGEGIYPASDFRYNALGTRPSGVPLPCEVYNETWD